MQTQLNSGHEDFVKLFLDTLRNQNYSKRTIQQYSLVLTKLSEYCKGVGKEIQDCTKKDVREFRKQLGQNIKPISVNGYTGAVKSFFRYLTKNITERNITDGIKKLREKKPVPSFVKEKDLERLIDSIDKDPTISLTTVTMFELLIGTGIRVSEMCDIEITDIDVNDPFLKVRHGKGNKERLVAIPRLTFFVIKKYLQYRKQIHPMSPFLFVNTRGGRMHRGNIYNTLRRFLDQTDSVKKGPHTLRHTYASLLINRGAPIAAIKELMGHSTVTVTQRYTHLELEAKKRIFDSAHPKA